MALRYTRWKVIFQEQRNEGFKIWTEPFVKPRAPALIDLRADPFEKGPMGAIYYSDWQAHRMFAFVPAQAFVAKWISSFKEFPPRQSPASFSIDAVMQRLEEAPSKAMRRFLSLSRENGLPHTLDRQALEWFKGGIITNGRPQELLDALRPQQSTRICPFPSYGYPQSRRDQAAHGRAPGFHEISKGYFAASQRDAARPFIETFTRAWTRLCKLTKAG